MLNCSIFRYAFVVTGFSLIFLVLSTWTEQAARAEDKKIELTYASYISTTSLHSEHARMWAREMEKRSKGRVRVTRWHYGGSLCGGAQQLGCIAQGLADFGYAAPSYNPAELRLATLTEMIYSSDVVGADVAARAHLYVTFPPFREEVRAAGLEVLTFHPTAIMLLGVSKRRNIKSSADLKGVKFHTYGPIGDIMRGVGNVSVAIPVGDVYESMSKGVIDGFTLPLWIVGPLKFNEVTGTMIDTGFGCAAAPFMVMNRKTYDRLPKDIQQIIEDLRQEQIVPEIMALERLEDAVYPHLKKNASDMKYLRFSKKAQADWRKMSKPEELAERLIKERENRSPYARDFFKKYVELVKAYEPEMKQIHKGLIERFNPKIID
jgi:TRAP-type C4-dicarboxylate transport system substrate-binding protein